MLVDPPDDFREAAADQDLWHLRFNFNGPDQLEHIFSTRGGELVEQGLKVPFPEHVERLQRRRNFRVDALTGTRMHFTLKKINGELDLINISQGGAYGEGQGVDAPALALLVTVIAGIDAHGFRQPQAALGWRRAENHHDIRAKIPARGGRGFTCSSTYRHLIAAIFTRLSGNRHRFTNPWPDCHVVVTIIT